MNKTKKVKSRTKYVNKLLLYSEPVKAVIDSLSIYNKMDLLANENNNSSNTYILDYDSTKCNMTISVEAIYQVLLVEVKSTMNTLIFSQSSYYNYTLSNGNLSWNESFYDPVDISVSLKILLNTIDFSTLDDDTFYKFITILPTAVFNNTNFENLDYKKKVAIVSKFPSTINYITGTERLAFQAYYLLNNYNTVYSIKNLKNPHYKIVRYAVKSIFNEKAPEIKDDILKIKETYWYKNIDNLLEIGKYLKNNNIKLTKKLEELVNERLTEIENIKASIELYNTLHLGKENR